MSERRVDADSESQTQQVKRSWSANSPEWQRVAEQIIEATAMPYAECQTRRDLYKLAQNRTPELAEHINQLVLEIRDEQNRILRSHGLLGRTLDPPEKQILDSLQHALDGMILVEDLETGRYTKATSSVDELYDRIWIQTVDLSGISFPGFKIEPSRLGWNQKHELLVTWLTLILAGHTYFYARNLIDRLDSLNQYITNISNNKSKHLDNIRSSYASVISELVKVQICSFETVSTAAREAYPIGTFPLRVDGMQATASVLHLLRGEHGCWARNLMFQDKALPTDSDYIEIELISKSISQSIWIREHELASRIEKSIVLKRLGIEYDIQLFEIFNNAIRGMGDERLQCMCRAQTRLKADWGLLKIALEQEHHVVLAACQRQWEECKARVVAEGEMVQSGLHAPIDPMQVPRLGKWYQQACEEYFSGVGPALDAKTLHYEQTHGTLVGTRMSERGHWMYRAIDVVSYDKFAHYADAIRVAVQCNFAGERRKLTRNPSPKQSGSPVAASSRK